MLPNPSPHPHLLTGPIVKKPSQSFAQNVIWWFRNLQIYRLSQTKAGRLVLDPQTEKVARFSDFDLSCQGGVGTKGIFPFKGKNMDQPNLLMLTNDYLWGRKRAILSLLGNYRITFVYLRICIFVSGWSLGGSAGCKWVRLEKIEVGRRSPKTAAAFLLHSNEGGRQVYFCICVLVYGHVVQRVGNSSGSSSHFIINHLNSIF